jgi:hypothetical protein
MSEGFNGRELAIIIWSVAAFVALFIWVPEFRRSLRRLLEAAFKPQLLLMYALLALYVAVLIRALAAFDLWSMALMKDTAIWFVFIGFPMIFSLGSTESQDGLFRSVLARTLGLYIVLEFLIENYTLSLWGELILIPAAVIVTGLVVAAESDKRYLGAHKFFVGIQGIIGLVMIWVAISGAIADRGNLLSFGAFLNVVLVPVLSLALIPFLYLLSLFSGYNQLFKSFSHIAKKRSVDPEVIRYAKLRFFAYLKLNRGKLLRFLKEHPPFRFSGIQNKADVDRLLDEDRGAQSEGPPQQVA